jgi:hypothetical protein
VLATAGLLPAIRAHACAGCRNPNIPITRLEAVQLQPGEVRASAVLGGTYVHVVHPSGCADLANCAEVPAQPTYLHDQRIYPVELRAVGEVGVTRSIGIELQVPVRTVGTTIGYSTPDGAPYVPADPDVHHRDETLTGIADPWLLARWGLFVEHLTLTLRLGTTLPLGHTEANPFALGDQGLRHQHIQFGTGTFDPVAAFEVTRLLGIVQLASYGQAQVPLYQNKYGFRAPARFMGGLQAGRRLFEKISGGLGAEILHETPERWDGAVRQDGNLGRTEVLAALSLMRPLGEQTSFGVVARIPVWRHIVAGTEAQGSLRSPLMLSVVVSRTFGGP